MAKTFEKLEKATPIDSSVLAALAVQMWSGNTLDELKSGFEKLTANNDSACFIKYIDDHPVGFAQCQLRHDYVEGAKTSPVGYLEGIFILDNFRHRGYAKELLAHCEAWAKERGCTEFASDCKLENDDSLKFHIAMGFEETARIICFKKSL